MKKKKKKTASKKKARASTDSPWAIVFIAAIVAAGLAAFIKEYQGAPRVPASQVR